MIRYLLFFLIAIAVLAFVQFLSGERQLPTVPEPTLRCSSTDRAVADEIVAQLALSAPSFIEGERRLSEGTGTDGTTYVITQTCETANVVEGFAATEDAIANRDLTGAVDVTGRIDLVPEGASEGSACTGLRYEGRVAYRLDLGARLFIADLRSLRLTDPGGACGLIDPADG